MGFFDIFKSSKNENKHSISNSIGSFSFTEFDGTKNYIGIIDSKIDQNIELLFPINDNNISNYQIEYFKEIEDNWNSIFQQLKLEKTQIDFENYHITNIMIPDKNNNSYDIDAEIVLKKHTNIISVILNNLIVEEIIEI